MLNETKYNWQLVNYRRLKKINSTAISDSNLSFALKNIFSKSSAEEFKIYLIFFLASGVIFSGPTFWVRAIIL